MDKALKHLAIIPDGNRRYAKENGIPALEGHRRGYDLFKTVADWCYDRDIKEVTYWGWSTENWKRSQEEVGYLMGLALQALTLDLGRFIKDKVRLRIIGSRAELAPNLIRAIENAEAQTAMFTERRINILFNYGGRAEIIDVMKKLIAAGHKEEEITEELIKKNLWTHDVSDPDLIIRTSGEQRLSGFMPWGGVYSELYFVEKHWPAFTEETLQAAIDWFSKRERRFGGNGANSNQPSV